MLTKTRIIILIAIFIATIATAILDLYGSKLLIVHAIENNYRTPFSLHALAASLALLIASLPIYIALKFQKIPQAGLVTIVAITITLLLEHFLSPLLKSLISPYAWTPSLFIDWSLGVFLANYVLNHRKKNPTHSQA